MKISSVIGLILFIYPFLASTQTFKKGEGSEFLMKSNGQRAKLSIYVSSITKKNLGIEFHFGTGDLFVSNMWQQFSMSLNEEAPIKITSGYFKASLSRPPEKMSEKHFYSNKGVQIHDFLFSKSSDIEKDYIGDEKIELISGTLIAKHYRKKSDGQVVDYWISSKVMPIGLVKLVSKSHKINSNNYSLELNSLLRNVKPAIDPSKAIPMSQSTSNLLDSATTK